MTECDKCKELEKCVNELEPRVKWLEDFVETLRVKLNSVYKELGDRVTKP